MRETLYNQRFDDIYFSPEDGLAETNHVFLQGNGLPGRWDGCAHFTIAETGFGTGLNFLAAWAAFEQTAQPGQVLDYVSFELYPLAVAEIRQALAQWDGALGGRLEAMLARYPLRVKGFHRIVFNERVRLTLVFDDVNQALPQLAGPRGVDAWFLDGFAPSKNPEMWTGNLYAQMARLSNPGASAATFTVAGHVRRGLAAAGFEVEKRPGFGRKKDMCVARFSGDDKALAHKNDPKRIAIIGGGLAGTSCAYALRQYGLQPTLFEKADHLAAGASGNALGLYNPRFYAQHNAEADFYNAAYAQAVRTLGALDDVGFKRSGCLHLVTGPDKEKRYRALVDNASWHSDHLRLLDAEAASDVAGVRLAQDALYLPESGEVSPQALCRAYAAGCEVRTNTAVERLEGASVNGEAFDAVIIANAVAAREFAALSWLPLHTVRGQVSMAEASNQSAKIKTAICYGGYVTPATEGIHMVGSTFQKWLDHTDVTAEDHEDNLEKLAAAVPGMEGLAVRGGRAALRTAAPGHFPVIGAACGGDGNVLPDTYVSVAHGSHGIISSLAGAYLIADMVTGAPYSLGQDSVAALNAARLIRD